MFNVSRDVREYYSQMTNDGISIPECSRCNMTFLPPRALCPICGSDTTDWLEVPNALGTVYSLTRLSDGSAVALVDLDAVSGPGRLLANVELPDTGHVEIGDRVFVITREDEFELGTWIPMFRKGDE